MGSARRACALAHAGRQAPGQAGDGWPQVSPVFSVHFPAFLRLSFGCGSYGTMIADCWDQRIAPRFLGAVGYDLHPLPSLAGPVWSSLCRMAPAAAAPDAAGRGRSAGSTRNARQPPQRCDEPDPAAGVCRNSRSWSIRRSLHVRKVVGASVPISSPPRKTKKPELIAPFGGSAQARWLRLRLLGISTMLSLRQFLHHTGIWLPDVSGKIRSTFWRWQIGQSRYPSLVLILPQVRSVCNTFQLLFLYFSRE